MIEIKGLKELETDVSAASAVLGELDGELGRVTFDPDDPASLEAAITSAEQMVDEKVAAYAHNPLVAELAAGLKDTIRQGILDRAAAARLGSAHAEGKDA